MSNKLKSRNRKMVSIGDMTLYNLSRQTGAKVETLKRYLEAREEEITAGLIKEAQERLLKAEDYITVSNVLCSMQAIYDTWGNTKSQQRFLENYNKAVRKQNAIGVEAMYEELHKLTGCELEFDSVDLNLEFGFGGVKDGQKNFGT